MLTTGFQPCLQFCKFRAAYPNLIGIYLLYHNFAAKNCRAEPLSDTLQMRDKAASHKAK